MVIKVETSAASTIKRSISLLESSKDFISYIMVSINLETDFDRDWFGY
jgi:hypothetical protein